LVVKKKL